MTSYRTARIQPVAPWSPVDDPYRDTRAAAAFFLSWLPALLCGARIEPAPVAYGWYMCGVRFSLLLPKISAVTP